MRAAKQAGTMRRVQDQRDIYETPSALSRNKNGNLAKHMQSYDNREVRIAGDDYRTPDVSIRTNNYGNQRHFIKIGNSLEDIR